MNETLSAKDFLDEGSLSCVKERRQQQLTMAALVEQAIATETNAIIEAGVGTGKSFAYLIPALLSDKKVIISTGTKNLQDQLINKDIPALRDSFSKAGLSFTAEVMKGKSNYVCPLAADNYLKQPGKTLSSDFVAFVDLVKTAKHSGDKDSYTGSTPTDLHDLTAEDCIGYSCSYAKTCGYLTTKQAVLDADCVIMNHALLGQMLAIQPFEKRYKIDDYILIVDEAHKLVEFFRNTFSYSFTEKEPIKLFHKLSKVGGDHIPTEAHYSLCSKFKDIFAALPAPELQQDITIPNAPLQRALEAVLPYITEIQRFLRNRYPMLPGGESANGAPPLVTKVVSSIQWKLMKYKQGLEILLEFVKGLAPQFVCYVQSSRNQKELKIAPIHLGAYIEKHLTATTNIFTSATLQANRSFEHFKNEISLDVKDEYTLALDSPFEYEKCVALYLPKDLPVLNAATPKEELLIAARLDQLYTITAGRSLTLFTSKDELKKYAALVQRTYPRWKIYAQHDFSPAAEVLRRYLEGIKKCEPAVIFGLKSFFEGISIEGEQLVNVIVTKLPFPNFGDPIHKAKCKTVGEKESFMKISLPEMVQSLHQATGRLIRTKKDYGIISILDPRIHTKNYGSIVLKSLPFPSRTTNITSLRDWFSNFGG